MMRLALTTITALMFTSCAYHPPVYVWVGNTRIEAKAPKGIYETPAGTEFKMKDANFYPAYVILPKQNLRGGEQEAFIDPVIKAWNEAMGFEFMRKEGPGYPITAVYVETLPSKSEVWSAEAYRRPDHCDVYLKHAWVASGVDINLLIHELGHCVGFDHSSWRWSIMYPTVTVDQLITDQMRGMVLEELGVEK